MENIQIAGVVAEYNPFHSGHAYQLEATRAAGATHLCVVMSGNFVQRGEPAFLLKTLRAHAAVSCGADLVLELPLPWAMATAQRFAFGALSLLKALGCVDCLSFGSESGDLALLENAALAVTSTEITADLKALLGTGIPYAAARQKAVARTFGLETATVLSSPNDTLAVAYLEQNNLLGRPFRPLIVPRKGAAHDSEYPEGYASASFLRRVILEKGIPLVAPWIPEKAMELYRQAESHKQLPFSPHSLDTAVLCALRRMDRENFLQLPDLSEGLEGRLYGAAQQATSLEEFYTLAKTKRYSFARIRRATWSAFLGIDGSLQLEEPPYLRVLAMNNRGKEILRYAKKHASLPLSASLKELENLGGRCALIAKLESRSSDLFALGLPKPLICGSDYTHRLRG